MPLDVAIAVGLDAVADVDVRRRDDVTVAGRQTLLV